MLTLRHKLEQFKQSPIRLVPALDNPTRQYFRINLHVFILFHLDLLLVVTICTTE